VILNPTAQIRFFSTHLPSAYVALASLSISERLTKNDAIVTVQTTQRIVEVSSNEEAFRNAYPLRTIHHWPNETLSELLIRICLGFLQAI
jgi:hypothetical protein